MREQARMAEVLEEWMVQHKRMYEAHVAEQERLVQMLLSCHRQTLKEVELAGSPRGGGGEPVQPPQQETEPLDGADVEVEEPPPPLQQHETQTGPSVWRDRKGSVDALPRKPCRASGGRPVKPSDDADPDPEVLEHERSIEVVHKPKGDETSPEDVLDNWIRSSGMHTVSKWVKNYRKHPAGWGALLMIHGIPEVTARLRSKVDNYAIYSALFLSMSISLLVDAPAVASGACQEGGAWDWECHLKKRLYAFCFAIGTAAHMLSILVGMAFNNALNEAARDSDVFRMFARGKGFVATVKCERAFQVGCILDFIAVIVAVAHYLTWPEALGGAVVMTVVVLYIFRGTARLLFVNGSICQYWREELGGKPDKDDPYTLRPAVDLFTHREELNETYFKKLAACTGDAKQTELVLNEMHHMEPASHRHHHNSNARNVAIAGIF